MIDTIEFLKIIGNQVRMHIILRLYQASGEYLSMTSVRDEIGISKPNFSQHATVLRDAGIIDITATGRFSYMTLTPTEHQEKILDAIFEVDA